MIAFSNAPTKAIEMAKYKKAVTECKVKRNNVTCSRPGQDPVK